jgi:hypothetical protein
LGGAGFAAEVFAAVGWGLCWVAGASAAAGDPVVVFSGASFELAFVETGTLATAGAFVATGLAAASLLVPAGLAAGLVGGAVLGAAGALAATGVAPAGFPPGATASAFSPSGWLGAGRSLGAAKTRFGRSGAVDLPASLNWIGTRGEPG